MKSNWKKHLEKQKREGFIRDYNVSEKPPTVVMVGGRGAGKVASKGLEYLRWNLWYWANEQALTLEEEYLFSERKFRFDFAFPALKIAIEFEGGIFDRNGSHTSFKDMSKDIEKYNLAQRLGWKVLRYTAINYENLLADLNKLLTIVR